MVPRPLEERPQKGFALRVLLVRFSAIGDCVMAAWAATAIRNQHPEAFLGWALESRCVPVVDTDQMVSQLCVFPREKWKKKRGSPATLVDQMRTYLGLRKHRFDIAIDLQGHSKTALAARLSGAKTRLSARATDSLARMLNPVLSPPQAEGEHEIELYQRTLKLLGFDQWPDSPIMPELGGWESNKPLVTIQTGAGEEDKRVPISTWESVALALLNQGYEVVALGGPNDPKLPVDGVTDRVGTLSLREAMAAIKASQVHLAGDTGSGHIAAALGVPVVSVFGRTDPARFRPWTKHGIALREGSATGDTKVESIVNAARSLMEACPGSPVSH